jgi:soluble lytic murein transglycosylase-like protein
MSDLRIAMGDIAAIEGRIAQLSGDAAAQPATPARDQSVAAFEAMLKAPVAGTSAGAGAQTPPAQFEALIARAAAANGEDPALLKAIIANESSFDPAATSNAGARGLMQLMPATAAEVGVDDAYDPAQNIAGGTRYLSELMQRFRGDLPAAIAAYNAGPGAVAAGEVPAETRAYVRNVMEAYAHYRALE